MNIKKYNDRIIFRKTNNIRENNNGALIIQGLNSPEDFISVSLIMGTILVFIIQSIKNNKSNRNNEKANESEDIQTLKESLNHLKNLN